MTLPYENVLQLRIEETSWAMLRRKQIISQDCGKHMHVHMYRIYESLRHTFIAESDPAAHRHCQQQSLIKRNDTAFLTYLGKASPQST